MVNGHGGPGAGAGSSGVADMVTISDIDEHVINRNLKIRYSANKIYVSIRLYWKRVIAHIELSGWRNFRLRCKIRRLSMKILE